MSANRLRSPRILAIGTFKRVVNVNTLDAGDCSPLLGAEMLLREVDRVQRVVSISLEGALGRIPSLIVVSMARFAYQHEEFAGPGYGPWKIYAQRNSRYIESLSLNRAFSITAGFCDVRCRGGTPIKGGNEG